EIDFSAKLIGAKAQGTAQRFCGTMKQEIKGEDTPSAETITAPIQIDGALYDCIVDLQGYLTSSGSDNIPSGGTICFPLVVLGGDGKWYPVLKEELQGDPSELFEIDCQAFLGDCILGEGKWKTWENGHYFVEYKIEGGSQLQKVTVSATL